nr:MAG TPA: hypothetical protein [Caudoviricetes sp.]
MFAPGVMRPGQQKTKRKHLSLWVGAFVMLKFKE